LNSAEKEIEQIKPVNSDDTRIGGVVVFIGGHCPGAPELSQSTGKQSTIYYRCVALHRCLASFYYFIRIGNHSRKIRISRQNTLIWIFRFQAGGIKPRAPLLPHYFISREGR